jgi:S-DNA-T family DNA segregation ATPase FtsK/SpoIIIE
VNRRGARSCLIDDAEGIEDPARRLSEAFAASEPGFYAVVAGRSDGLGAIGHWTMAVRRSRIGLMLMPNVAMDGALLGVTLPRRPPPPRRPGCGYLVGSGGLELLQVADPGAPVR